jgi:4-hydroxybenzoate polyprenyltransferase
MKKAFWLPLAVAGVVFTLLAAASLFAGGSAGPRIRGIPPVYALCAGVGLLTAGLLIKNTD